MYIEILDATEGGGLEDGTATRYPAPQRPATEEWGLAV
jgi:hypothetical protein